MYFYIADWGGRYELAIYSSIQRHQYKVAFLASTSESLFRSALKGLAHTSHNPICRFEHYPPSETSANSPLVLRTDIFFIFHDAEALNEISLLFSFLPRLPARRPRPGQVRYKRNKHTETEWIARKNSNSRHFVAISWSWCHGFKIHFHVAEILGLVFGISVASEMPTWHKGFWEGRAGPFKTDYFGSRILRCPLGYLILSRLIFVGTSATAPPVVARINT